MTALEVTTRPTAATPAQNGIETTENKNSAFGSKAAKETVETIIQLLKKEPCTSGQLAQKMSRNPKTLRRDYLADMHALGMIAKDGDYYRLPESSNKRVLAKALEELSAEDFGKLECMQKFLKAMKEVTGGSGHYAKLRNICTGKYLNNFKIHPAAWTDQVSAQFLELYREQKKTDRIDQATRQTMRYLYEYVLEKPLTDAQKKEFGFDGKKDNIGEHANVKLTDWQIDALIDFFMERNDLEMAAYVAFALETFGRPESIFNTAIEGWQVSRRKITKAMIEGYDDPIYDAKMVGMLQALRLALPYGKISIETKETEIITGEIFENKTERRWKKFILHPKCVTVFKQYLETRKGRSKLFGGETETWAQFQNRIGAKIRNGYAHLGLFGLKCSCGYSSASPDQFITHMTERCVTGAVCKEREKTINASYWLCRPLYSMRHSGAHLWLRRTGYNYGAVAAMGWEDLSTLRTWYGEFDMSQLEQSLLKEW